jgi:outer membrane usher protein
VSLKSVARAGVATLASLATLLCGLLPSRVLADGAQLQRAYLTTRVNEAGGKDVLVLTRGEEILVHADELRELGLKIPEPAIVTIQGERFVSLRALGKDVVAKIDPVALTLAITLPPSMFDTQALAVDNQSRNVTVAPASYGSFLNYGLRASTGNPFSLVGQAGTRVGAGVLQSTLARPTQGAGYALRQTSYTIDSFGKAERAVLGAASVDANDFAGLGGAAYIDGFSVRRDLTLNPNLIRQSSSALTGVATSPSTVEVYVNGTLLRRDTVGPGAFEITNLPLQTGVNQTTVVVRDAFGHQQTIDRPDYLAADLLPRGERQFAFGAGRAIGDYRQALAAARYDLGIANGLTVSARGSLGAVGSNAGISTAIATPIGELSAVAAVSDARPGRMQGTTVIDAGTTTFASTPVLSGVRSAGNASALMFSRTTRRGYAGLSYVHRSPAYGSLSLDPTADRALQEMRAYASVALGAVSSMSTLSFELRNALGRDSGWSRSVDLTLRRPLGRIANFAVSAGSATLGAITRPTVAVQLTANLFGNHQISISSGSQNGSSSHTIGLMSPAATELGTSYNAQLTNGAYSSDTFSWERRGRLATLDVNGSQSGTAAPSYDATLSGAVAYAGGNWYLSRQITNGFGVVDVSGIPGIPVRVNGQAIGSTDARGRIFVPNLASSAVNDVALDSEHLPNDVTLEAVSAQVTPLYRSATMVRFNARRVHAYVGVLRLAGTANETPAYGVASVRTSQGDVESDIGSDGRFYFDQLAPGTYALHVRFHGGACSVKRFVLAEARSVVTNLGTLLCEREGI